MTVIAEIGINFAYGNSRHKFIDNIYKLIDLAVESGCDYVKFQKRNVDLAVPEAQKNKEKSVPWRTELTTYLQYKKDMELSLDDYRLIDLYCNTKKIKWLVSVWDTDSAKFMKDNFDVSIIKIPSAKITDLDLLDYCNNFNKVIISTGMSTEEEIDTAVKSLNKCDLTILHCNSSYPAKDSELNLNYIPQLKLRYPNNTIGYSGHEEGISACMVAKTLGAEVIERHITLSRSNWGTDQSASLVFDQLYRLTRDLKKINMWLGDGIKKVYNSELPIKSKLRG